jgi:DNA polymerase zeta
MTSTSMDTFSVRLNAIDHYQAIPNPAFDPPVPRDVSSKDTKNRPRVSVIRVFGATDTGQKVLLHIHGAFQYTYIEYSGSLLPDDVNNAIRTLRLSIDHALAVSYRKNVYDGKHSYVAHISLVKGVPFYGYHVGYKTYLKIYLLNPLHMTRLADLLREGAVMKRVLQPYESHMQYLAQWMCDHNLYGCAYIDCEKATFRAPVPAYLDMTSDLHRWHDQSISPECISDEMAVPKVSHCALEVDIRTQDITNRRDVEARPIHHDFIERLKPLPIDAKLVQSMAGLWRDETRRRQACMGLLDPKSSPFPPEVLITMSADLRNTEAGGWIHEEEYREKMVGLAKDDYDQSDRKKLTFENHVRSLPLMNTVKTALESVEDLYPENLQDESNDENLRQDRTERAMPDASHFVDESRVRAVADESSSDPDFEDARQRARAEHAPSKQTNGQSHKIVTALSPRAAPLSSAELEEMGIRRAGDFKHVQDDAFEIPPAYRRAVSNVKGKRARFNVSGVKSSSRKRRRLVDVEDLVSGSEMSDSSNGTGGEAEPVEDANILAEDHFRSGQVPNGDVAMRRKTPSNGLSSSQRSTLAFPIVKDPNDPSPILRLSQGSTPSQKLIDRSSQRTPITKLAVPKTPFKTPLRTPISLIGDTSRTTGTTPGSKSSVLAVTGLKLLPKPKKGNSLICIRMQPPPWTRVETTMAQYGLPDVIYRDAYYSNQEDVPDRPRDYAGKEFKLESTTVPYLPDFDPSGTSPATFGRKQPLLLDEAVEENADAVRRRQCRLPRWSVASTPPRKAEVLVWLEQDRKKNFDFSVEERKSKPLSQVEGPTQKNKHGSKYSQKQANTSVQHETQYMSLMSLEIHVNTRGKLAPNPEEDEVACIFWCVQTDDEEHASQGTKDGMHAGIITLATQPGIGQKIAKNIDMDVQEEKTEVDLLTRVVDMVRYFDPDILTGFEVHNSSWGYLIERGRLKYDMNLCDELSRMKSQSHGRFGKDDDKWGFNHTSTIRVTGRHTINIWRAMRGELNLLQYTMENIVFHVLHRRIPHFPFVDLTRWYTSKNPRDLAKVIKYFTSRVQIDLEILDANELVPRTSEQARLLGVDWFSVISRGSQFKVESLMFRIAKPENFILISPSRRQVGGQNALECLPLVMEPQSNFYTSPLLVLDFQSLYPSVMIAYNYCYSTFLGRVVGWRGTNKMGFTDYAREPRLLELLKDHINIAPNGIMYAKQQVRKSLLAKMLSEILETRVMVKSGMKLDKDDKTLQRLLNNRQLALKLIANVTYGYTSASFSGRMPCSEIADSIVQTGRETLEKAIALIHSVERWGAEVVYGDTDSLFVYLKGRTREQAFDIGEEIAATITNLNPRPVKLKFEKVYHPCVLLAKKRYVGFKYEHRDQKVPDFDAKGIETVRRDGTPAEQKIEENALKVLFRTADLSQVKSFFQMQCSKIMRGKVSIQDFCFAKEVRLGTYSDKGPPPPGALISARRMLEDPRLEPQYGERVPYVVVTGGPGARLIDRCVAPDVLLNDAQSELDAEYYISKNLIPPLERIFNLAGANVRQWFDEMPKYQRIRRVDAAVLGEGREVGMSKKTLENYMKMSTCIVCSETVELEGSSLCYSCESQADHSLLRLRAKLNNAERKATQLAMVCRSCSGLGWDEEIKCDSKDCPVFYSRVRQSADIKQIRSEIMPVLFDLERKSQQPRFEEVPDIDW